MRNIFNCRLAVRGKIVALHDDQLKRRTPLNRTIVSQLFFKRCTMSYRITALHKLSILLFTMLIFQLAGGYCLGQDQPLSQVVRVEEDWKMVLGIPDPESIAPQITCMISPIGDVNSLHAAFTLNHRGMPDFSPGGLQLQVWDNESPLFMKNFSNTSILSHDNEIVTWTQAMELKDGALTFEVVNGHSETWNHFGDQNSLKAVVNSVLPNLNNYHPNVSVNNSGIGFASNRVQSLVLQRVRLILSTGQIIEEDTPRIVYQQK